MDWSIQEIARLTGTTSRTLRHYDAVGLLPPTSVAANGYRRYDEAALVRLQRILLLKGLGLPLREIAEMLNHTEDSITALEKHVLALGCERERIDRQLAAVTATITRLKAGEPLMAEEMFDGFDHREYEHEVTQRWGAEAFRTSDDWWNGLSQTDRGDFKARITALNRDWIAAYEAGEDPRSRQAQELAARHIDWLRQTPGTPAAEPGGDLRGYVTGLAQMYVADARFAANYGGAEGAGFVRDALLAHLDAGGA